MLFRQAILDAIARGEVTLAFRRWRRPSVKEGGRLHTPVGLLAIERVEVLGDADLATVSDAEARRAGFANVGALAEDLASQRAGTLHRIAFHLAGPDPRVALREQAELTEAEAADLCARLARLDRAARTGPWTRVVLEAIRDGAGMRSADLARRLGRDQAALKLDVRKLKNLGLTESLGTGYRLSPRGDAVLRHLARSGPEGGR